MKAYSLRCTICNRKAHKNADVSKKKENRLKRGCLAINGESLYHYKSNKFENDIFQQFICKIHKSMDLLS